MEDDDGLIQIPHEDPLERKGRSGPALLARILQQTSLMAGNAAFPTDCWVGAAGSHLQVAVWRRGGVVLTGPASGFRSPAPARPLIQLFDRRGRTLNCVKVP